MTDDSFQLAKNALLRFTIILYIIYIIYNIIVTFSFFSFENCHLSSVIDAKLTFREDVVLCFSKRRFMVSYFLTSHDIVVPLQCQTNEGRNNSHTRP